MSCDDSRPSLKEWTISSLSEPIPLAAKTIGFLDPPGTFCEQALRSSIDAQTADGTQREFLPFSSMGETIEAASSGAVDCALVPIENSIEGSVSATVDILAHEVDNLQMVREVTLPISQCLITRTGVSLEQVT